MWANIYGRCGYEKTLVNKQTLICNIIIITELLFINWVHKEEVWRYCGDFLWEVLRRLQHSTSSQDFVQVFLGGVRFTVKKKKSVQRWPVFPLFTQSRPLTFVFSTLHWSGIAVATDKPAFICPYHMGSIAYKLGFTLHFWQLVCLDKCTSNTCTPYGTTQHIFNCLKNLSGGQDDDSVGKVQDSQAWGTHVKNAGHCGAGFQSWHWGKQIQAHWGLFWALWCMLVILVLRQAETSTLGSMVSQPS